MAAQSNESDTRLELLISFYQDISFERARKITGLFSKTPGQETYISGNRVLVKMYASRLAEITGYDEVSWIEEGARIKKPANCDAARLSKVDHVQSGDYELDGQGVVMGQWDGGAVDNTHPDLSEQVTIYTDRGISWHATGVSAMCLLQRM